MGSRHPFASALGRLNWPSTPNVFSICLSLINSVIRSVVGFSRELQQSYRARKTRSLRRRASTSILLPTERRKRRSRRRRTERQEQKRETKEETSFSRRRFVVSSSGTVNTQSHTTRTKVSARADRKRFARSLLVFPPVISLSSGERAESVHLRGKRGDP